MAVQAFHARRGMLPPRRQGVAECVDAAAQLASGASRAACYADKDAARPGRIDPT
jgi:hypothetical protein